MSARSMRGGTSTGAALPGLNGFVAGITVPLLMMDGGVAAAAIPFSTTSSYTACVNKTTGATRVIDVQRGKTCTSNEQLITWTKGHRHRNAWSPTPYYSAQDVVTTGGSSYVVKTSSLNKAPASSTTARGLLAARGVVGPQGLTGTKSDAGGQGLTGATGPTSPPGRRSTFTSTAQLILSAGYGSSVTATCDPGTLATSGGYEMKISGGLFGGHAAGLSTVSASRPLTGATAGWRVTAVNNESRGDAILVTVWAGCA